MVYRSYFLVGFFFPLVFLGTVLASDYDFVDFAFKSVYVTKLYMVF